MKWTRARLEDCANHYRQCEVCQRERFTPLFSFHRWKRMVQAGAR